MADLAYQAYVKRFRAVFLSLTSFAFAFVAIFVTTQDGSSTTSRSRHRLMGELLSEYPEILWFFAAVFLIMGIMWLRYALNPSAAVRIESDGVTFHLLSEQKISFSNIKTARLLKIQRASFLEFELVDGRNYDLKLFQKIMRLLSFKKAYRPMISHLDKSPDEIWSAFQSRMNPLPKGNSALNFGGRVKL